MSRDPHHGTAKLYDGLVAYQQGHAAGGYISSEETVNCPSIGGPLLLSSRTRR